MKVFASVEDQWRQDVPGLSNLREYDLYGRRANTLCLFNPDVKEFWTALVADLCSSYPIDGILFLMRGMDLSFQRLVPVIFKV